MRSKFITSAIIPTGIKASVGGYLGDATPFINKIALLSDFTITNPNTVNGGVLNLMRENVLYTEGTMMDLFFRGDIRLKPAKNNRIGVVIEQTGDKGAMALLKNTINAMRAVAGIEVIGIETTERKVGAKAYIDHGVARGEVDDLSALDAPVRTLIAKGADAIALSAGITCGQSLWKSYFKGKVPNPVGALEAVISHYVVEKYKIPAAHAPLVPEKDWHINLKNYEVFWRAGAEAISPAYLGSVLIGLANAPRISAKGIYIRDVAALVIPHSACGGVAVFECMKKGIPVIAVKEIATNLNVTPESIGIDAISVKTMQEALGRLKALKNIRQKSGTAAV